MRRLFCLSAVAMPPSHCVPKLVTVAQMLAAVHFRHGYLTSGSAELMGGRSLGWEMKNPVDIQIGQRLRNKRWLAGLTQQNLAEAVGIRFQQIQKYESGANRISAARLWELARALDVPVSYFYTGLDGAAGDLASSADERMDSKETFELVRAYYDMAEPARRRMLALTQALAGTPEEEAPASTQQIALTIEDAR